MTAANIIHRRLLTNRLLVRSAVLLASVKAAEFSKPAKATESAKAAEPVKVSRSAARRTASCAAITGRAPFPLLYNLLVRLLNLLKAFFRLILVGIVDIGIGMVFAA